MTENSKNILTSKTFWANVIFLVLAILELGGVTNVLSSEQSDNLVLGIIAIVNVIIRFSTYQAVHVLPKQ